MDVVYFLFQVLLAGLHLLFQIVYLLLQVLLTGLDFLLDLFLGLRALGPPLLLGLLLSGLDLLLRDGGLDAALIDVTLPDGNGLDLVREIKDGTSDGIPTLVLTAGLDHSVAAQAVEAGAQGAQSKVVSMPETVETIKRLTGHQEG